MQGMKCLGTICNVKSPMQVFHPDRLRGSMSYDFLAAEVRARLVTAWVFKTYGVQSRNWARPVRFRCISERTLGWLRRA